MSVSETTHTTADISFGDTSTDWSPCPSNREVAEMQMARYREGCTAATKADAAQLLEALHGRCPVDDVRAWAEGAVSWRCENGCFRTVAVLRRAVVDDPRAVNRISAVIEVST